MPLLAVLLLRRPLLAGFRNRELVWLMGSLLDAPYTNRQATYDLRRLRRKGLIVRLPHSQTFEVTPYGRQVASLFTRRTCECSPPGPALLAADLSPMSTTEVLSPSRGTAMTEP